MHEQYYSRVSEVRHLRTLCLLLVMAICILMIALLYMATLVPEAEAAEAETEEAAVGAPTLCEDVLPTAPALSQVSGPEASDHEPTYFRDDINLGVIEQKQLYDAAAEFGVDYELMLAVCEQETDFRNIIGDDGASCGYFQVQPRWWRGLMDEIDADDLMEPADNFRTACAIIRELLDDYGGSVRDALSTYNTGHPGASPYAAEVLERWAG